MKENRNLHDFRQGNHVYLNMSLCNGRHSIPEATDGSIFETEIQNITDTHGLMIKAFNAIWNAAYTHYNNNEYSYLGIDPEWDGSDMTSLVMLDTLHVNIYVTGLTVALIAAINACKVNNISVTLYHFNRETGTYYPQEVL